LLSLLLLLLLLLLCLTLYMNRAKQSCSSILAKPW
jgi:hypothetical protein